MTEPRVGLLVPLQGDLVVDDSVLKIPILEGANVVGRNNLTLPDKRVSRKHISLHASVDGSAEVVVEGPNPIILKSGNTRKKFCSQERFSLVHGDIVELIPGNYLFEFATVGGDHESSAANSRASNKEKRHSEEDTSAVKRNRQILEDEAFARTLQKNKPSNWVLHKPPLPISYGTHHSKAMLLVYPRGVRVVVHTANLIYVDWNNKSQGLWMQDFPWKDQKDLSKGCFFENDLVDYLSKLKWPDLRVNLPMIGNVNINASFFNKFDYSSAKVRLIASVPGYHMGPDLKKWGHMKLRNVLEECIFDKEFCKAPLVYQFSSLGSLDERWLAELASSMSSGFTNDKSPLGIGKPLIIWPTVEDVRCSLEGYAAGNAIPSPQKNVEKDFLKKYWARWRANHAGRCHAMPHIKTYTRYNGQNLAWFLLTSANLSKAAWGALQKNNSQLMIRSYELGVLFLPSTIQDHASGFSCTADGGPKQGENKPSETNEGIETKLVTLCWKGSTDPSTEVIRLPLPYQLPPQPYTSEDVPWSWDRRYTKKDVYGQVWPRHVQLYLNQDS